MSLMLRMLAENAYDLMVRIKHLPTSVTGQGIHGLEAFKTTDMYREVGANATDKVLMFRSAYPPNVSVLCQCCKNSIRRVLRNHDLYLQLSRSARLQASSNRNLRTENNENRLI